MNWESGTTLLLPAVAAFAVWAGFRAGRRGRDELVRQLETLTADAARSEAQGREQQRQLSRLRNEQRSISNFSRFLPNVVRELNRSDLSEREIPGLVLQLVESVFEPEQVALYTVRAPGDDRGGERGQEMYLVQQRGLGGVPASLARIPVGHGKIGWVAEHQVEMLQEDWLNLTRTDGRSIEDNHSSLKLDMIGPLVHHHGSKDQLLGVLCIGSPTVRPRDDKLLLQTITNLASIAYINSRNVRSLRDLANHDGLTGLLNKRYFLKEKLGLMLNAAYQEAQSLGVFIFDIDHFKHYNDLNGHVAGDEILRGVAGVLRSNMRPDDIACRYGGEEFVVAMPQVRGPEAMAAADRIRKAIESQEFPAGDRQPLGAVTISGGVSVFPLDGTDGTALIRRADEALYKAKAQGRNRVLLYRGVEIGDGADEPADPSNWIGGGSTLER